MGESTLERALSYTKRSRSGGPERLAAAGIGVLLIFSAPYHDGNFKDWLIPFVGPYRVSLFEVVAIAVSYIALLGYGIRLRRNEQFVFLSIIIVIASRIVSVLAAEELLVEQVISVLRYAETLVIIYACAKLFCDPINRVFFIWGVIVGVFIETVGGIYVFLSAGGQARGLFVSVNSFMLQVFLVIACFVSLVNRKRRAVMSVCIVVMVLGIFASMTRAALIMLVMGIGVAIVYTRELRLKPLVFLMVVIAIGGLAVVEISPIVSQAVTARINAAFAGEGGVLYRFYLWDMALGTFLQHPVTGIGSGGFARQQEKLPQVFGVELPAEYSQLDYQASTHSTILGVASETGLLGLAAYLLWAIAVIGTCSKALRSASIGLDKYLIAASALVIALTISDIWGQGSFTSISNSFIGFVMGHRRENFKTWRR